jgi:hypothetical protein
MGNCKDPYTCKTLQDVRNLFQAKGKGYKVTKVSARGNAGGNTMHLCVVVKNGFVTDWYYGD